MLVGLALASLPAVLFPGDAPFVNDEPMLILSALQNNAAHSLAVHGLGGSFRVLYGPVPVWIYQLLLCLSHRPVVLVAVHAAALALGTAVALWSLARNLRLWAPFAIVVVLSPSLWFQERYLWDNTFNIPVCALVLAAYAGFLVTGSRAALGLTVAGLSVAPFIHPMALALVVPVGLHLLVFEHRALLRHARWMLPFPILFLFLAAPYLLLTVKTLGGPVTLGANADASSKAAGFAFPALGGRFLSAAEFYDWAPGTLYQAARLVSAVAYPLVWAGIALAALRLLRLVYGHGAVEVRDHVAGLALAIVATQGLLDGLLNASPLTHYFNATWIAYAFLAWLAVDAMVRARSRVWRALALVVPAHGAALAIVDVGLIAAIHWGPPSAYGASIANQVAVAREILRYPAETPVTGLAYPYRDFPHALTAMEGLLAPAPVPTASARRLVIRTRALSCGGRRAVVVAQ